MDQLAKIQVARRHLGAPPNAGLVSHGLHASPDLTRAVLEAQTPILPSRPKTGRTAVTSSRASTMACGSHDWRRRALRTARPGQGCP